MSHHLLKRIILLVLFCFVSVIVSILVALNGLMTALNYEDSCFPWAFCEKVF